MPLRKAARVGAILAILFALGLVLRHLPVLRWVVAGANVVHELGWPGALLTFVAIYLLTLLLLPIIPFIIACGWLYGVPGSAVSLAAAVASASTAFVVARALGGSAAAAALLRHPKARALAELAAEGGLLTVVLVRLSPILPFTPSNAVMGLTPMRFRDVSLGTALGMAPGIVLYSWAGSLLPTVEALEQGERLARPAVWILLGTSFCAAAVLGTAAARRLRQRAGPPVS
jgi:phospholipase D1/2